MFYYITYMYVNNNAKEKIKGEIYGLDRKGDRKRSSDA